MTALQLLLRPFFLRLDSALSRAFGPAWNPFHNLGALGFFFYWIVAISGIYIYLFFDTGITEAYDSVDYMTNDQWYLAGVMRSLHRYASDCLVLVMFLHLTREFAYDRYRGARWFSWLTGVPIIWFVFASGITGYWLVWDELAQYVAINTTEWLDWLPIFGEPIARNFLSPDALDDRFFTLLVFLHIAVPLLLLLVLWIHLQRVSRPRINPPRGLALSTFAALLLLSIVLPATSHAPANLSRVPTVLNLDWFYLGFYPLIDLWPHGAVWAMAVVLTLMIAAMPWLPPFRRPAAARVNLDNCNGCTRCADDCPFNAITMAPRSDGKPFEREAVVDASLCTSCGICAGACPTATPFRRGAALVAGIELPDASLAGLREQIELKVHKDGGQADICLVSCAHGVRPEALQLADTVNIILPCIGALPPPFIDYLLTRCGVAGVFLTGCAERNCHYRLGNQWAEARLLGQRDPILRRRVPRERVRWGWFAPHQARLLRQAIEVFRADVKALPQQAPPDTSEIVDRLRRRAKPTLGAMVHD